VTLIGGVHMFVAMHSKHARIVFSSLQSSMPDPIPEPDPEPDPDPDPDPAGTQSLGQLAVVSLSSHTPSWLHGPAPQSAGHVATSLGSQMPSPQTAGFCASGGCC